MSDPQEQLSEEKEEDEATSLRLKAFLQEAGIPFKVTTHRVVRTSEEAAAVRGVSLDSGAKAILLKDSKSSPPFCLAVFSASKRFSSKQFKKVTGRKKIRFATTEELWEVARCVPGAVPPFGSIFEIPLWVDRSLSRQEVINFNCGLRTASISMTYGDYITVEKPNVDVFSEEEMELGDSAET
ncbi:Pfam:YbaK [Seminavis robusta]|uniref:Pfam:YbaK n=1 Tax=Seminavis robusta TaxID=568900 RepID=A0A9N8HCY8_9STRA|nr:Pfam:YbaK [Seminavis robusta]|eukprot:Sro435_g142210.1 Pfam:YbaK (183) ;mRNA; f:5903-6451